LSSKITDCAGLVSATCSYKRQRLAVDTALVADASQSKNTPSSRGTADYWPPRNLLIISASIDKGKEFNFYVPTIISAKPNVVHFAELYNINNVAVKYVYKVFGGNKERG